MKNQLNLRQKHSVSAMLTLVFKYVQEHFVNLVKSFSVLVLPWIVVSSICIGYVYSTFAEVLESNNVTPDFTDFRSMLLLIPGCIFGYIAMILFSGTITSYMKLALSHHKSEITLKMISSLVKKYFLKLFMGILLCGISILVLYTLVIAPLITIEATALVVVGIIIVYLSVFYFMVVISLYAFAIIIEEKSKMASFKRCFQLIYGYWWRSFGFIILLSIIQSMLSYILIIPVYAYNFWDIYASMLSGDEPDVSALTQAMKFMMPIMSVTYSFFFIISGVGFGVNYFSLVEIKDEVGLKEKIAAISEQTEIHEA